MTDDTRPEGAGRPAPSGAAPDNESPVIRDNRVVDPQTGEVRTPDAGGHHTEAGVPMADGDGESAGEAARAAEVAGTAEAGLASAAQALAQERLADLQRLNAEYVNYRKRVDRDRGVEYARGVSDVVDAVIPVLDDIDAARRHEELTGPFAAIAEKLETVLAQRFDVERYGEAGEEFDPNVHEALMHATSEDAEVTAVAQVLQPGYRAGGRIVRAARVAVVGPE